MYNDEQPNQQNQQNQEMTPEEMMENQVKQQVENAAKKTAKNGAKALGRALKKLAKEALKKLIAVIGIKGVLIIVGVILVAIIIILLLGLFENYLSEEYYNDTSNILKEVTTAEDGTSYEEANARALVKIEGRKLILDTTEFFAAMDKWFKENSQSPKDYWTSDDYKELKAFLEAEVVTLYPDLREREEIEAGEPIPEGEIQGCVKFNRKYSDGSTSQLLEYMPYEDFANELAKLGNKLDESITQEQIYFNRADVDQQYNLLRDKFTLDENQNLVIVDLSYNETVVTYSDYAEEENKQYRDGTEYSYSFGINVTRVNYQEVLKPYTMPFELGVALLITTENPGFCMEVANLAKESNIVIDIQENNTTTIDERVYSYTSDMKKEVKVEYTKVEYVPNDDNYVARNKGESKSGTHPEQKSGSSSTTVTTSTQIDNYETITTTDVTNNIYLCVTDVDTWIAHYESVYTNQPETIQGESVTDVIEDVDRIYVEVPNYHHVSFPDPSPSGSTVTKREEKLYERNIGQKWKYTNTVKTNTYNKTSSKGRFVAEKFLSLLKVDPTNIEKPQFNLNDNNKNTQLMYYYNIDNVLDSPSFYILKYKDWLNDLLLQNDKTKNLAEIVEYLLKVYKDPTIYDENKFAIYEPYEFTQMNRMGGRGGSYYGSNLAEKIWFALKDEGFSDYAAAGALGNLDYESAGLYSNVVQGSTGNSEYSISYTEKVDNGTISKQEFAYNGPGGGGYGLAQWTDPGRKSGLYEYTINDLNVSISNADAQIRYLIAEIKGTHEYHAQSIWITRTGDGRKWSKEDWINAKNVQEATRAFCHAFEGGDWSSERLTRAQKYYDSFANGRLQKPSYNCETIEAGGHVYPHYFQRNYAHVIYKTYDNGADVRTVKSSGCAPTSLAMILSGLLNDPSIDPETLVANLKEYFPKGEYHVRALKKGDPAGSTDVLYDNGFLGKYYNCKSIDVKYNRQAALEALEQGYPCMGHESGHLLAVVPAPDELKEQGYKFYIIDSARGHSGPYKSYEAATAVVDGTFNITYVIKPL